MNYQLQNADRMSQYHRLILYIEYANETSAILNGEEVYAYFYNNFAMDMYINKQSRMDATDAKIEMYIKRGCKKGGLCGLIKQTILLMVGGVSI
jgi:hypothetical protein